MCAASVVVDAIRQQWPALQTINPLDLLTLQAILQRLDAMDKRLGAIECKTDAPKVAFLAELEQLVAAAKEKARHDGRAELSLYPFSES